MKAKALYLSITVLLLLLHGPLRAQAPPAGFTSTVVAAGWDEAVGLAFTSTGSRLFVWERPGRVWVVTSGQRQLVLDISQEVGGWEDHGLLGFALDPNFTTNGYLYLLYVVDRHHLLHFGTPAYGAATNDYFGATIGRLTRYTALPAGPGYAVDPASRRVLLGATKTTGIPSTFNGHVTAGLQFGTDGTLLVATGDGAHTYQDMGNYNLSYAAQAQTDGIITATENVGSLRAQLVNCLSGKILRLDPATGAGVAGNPFFDAAAPNAPRSKVWALGLRNPFRMSLKPGTGSTERAAADPGTIYLGDVGAATWEEVDVLDRPGQNLGWPLFEGLTPFDVFASASVPNRDAPNPLYGTGGCTQPFFSFRDLIRQATPTGTAAFANSCNAAQAIPTGIPTFVHTRPLLDWAHGAGPARTGTFSGSTATTASLGAAGAPVSGAPFGGGSCSGGVFYPHNDFPAAYRNTYFFGDYVGGWVRSLTVSGTNQPSAVGNFVDSGAVPVAFATSPSETGLFYVNFYPSEIRKISYVTASSPPVAVATANQVFGPGPLAVQFTGSASTDPGGRALTYRWSFGDGGTSPAANPAHTFVAPTSAPATFAVTLTVTNALGLTNQAALTISVGNNTPPQVTITSPAAGTRYPLTANTVYNLRATVTDDHSSGHLLRYRWQTLLHHASHEHPDVVDTLRQTSTTIVPYGCGAEAYYYRIVLTVTDADGLATSREVRLDPDCTATSFTLVNADDNADILALTNGAVLNLAALPTRHLNVRANANPATTGSVVFALSGAAARTHTENVAPYALFSDDNGAYVPWTPPVGSYALRATPYAGPAGTGAAGAALAINFTVTDAGPTGPYALSTAVFGGGTLSRSPDQPSYASGTSVVLTATPAAGFSFGGWSGSATGTANPLTVPMTTNKSITATFTAVAAGPAVASYTLVSADTNADIQPLPAGAVLNLATLPTRHLNIRANTSPAAVGSVVFALSGAVARGQTESVAPYALFSDDGGAYVAWTPPVGNYSLLATPFAGGGGTGSPGTALAVAFSVIDQPAGPFMLTTALMGSGAVAWTPSQTSYAAGSSVVLTATPAAGFAFAGWSGDATGTANPLTVVMTASKSITATFTAIAMQYVLGVAVVGSGTVARSPSQASYASGTVVTLAATPAAGYQFSGWSGGATGTANPLTLTMTADRTITATFVATSSSYTLTTARTGSGTVARSPNQTSYASGTVVTLTATPAAGYQFSGWSGSATDLTNPLAVPMTANKSITAAFTVVPGQQVSSLTLMNADTDQPLQALPTGAVLNLATLPTRHLSIRATTTPAVVGSVVFNLSGPQPVLHTENLPPYALLADSNGDYNPWTPVVGSYTLLTTPYTGAGGGGQPGTPLRTSFSVTDAVARPAVPGALATAPTTAAPGTARASVPAAAGAYRLTSAVAYPNPSGDGRFFLVLPAGCRGRVAYRLVSVLGTTVAQGEIAADSAAPRPLDFSRATPGPGLYFLLLSQAAQAARLKLRRE